MNVIINPAKTCAFTGHRTLGADINERKIKTEIKKLIKDGFDTFLCGMAIGFDITAGKIIAKLKKKNNLKLIACIPCENQSSRYDKKQKEDYDYILSVADDVVLISKEYTPSCMQKRNIYMVDRCSVVLAYLRQERGGTVNTVKYAKKVGKEVIVI
ncbi:MAG: DUF1273 family protein [Clostridia bacterium]|nr:DUF1273 family protein [Clostridia bacterium]